MAGKSKRQEDAESIVGKHAEELEVEDQKLVGRTSGEIDPLAVVERKLRNDDEEEEANGATEDEEEEDEEGKGKRKKGKGKKKAFKGAAPPFGGAKSLAAAEAFMVERAGSDPILLDSLNVLAGVLTNIAGAEHGEAIATELADYQTRLDAQVLRTLNSVEQSLTGKEAPMPEDTEAIETPQAEAAEAEAAPDAAEVEAQPEANASADEHVLEPVFASLRAAYDEARETPADQAIRLKMLQKPLNEFAAVLKANIGGDNAPVAEAAGSGVTIEQIQQVVTSAVAPIAAEVEALKSASIANAPDEAEPVRRALQTAAFAQVGSGPQKEVIMESDRSNPKTNKNVTPGLRNLVRRTVGLGG